MRFTDQQQPRTEEPPLSLSLSRDSSRNPRNQNAVSFVVVVSVSGMKRRPFPSLRVPHHHAVLVGFASYGIITALCIRRTVSIALLRTLRKQLQDVLMFTAE